MTLTVMELVAAAKQQIREVDAAHAQTLLGKSLILDVREPAEFEASTIPGAINIPRGVVEFKIDAHPAFHGKQDEAILVFCLTGGRSALAVESLQKLGWTKLVSLAGGFNAWIDAVGDIVT